MRVSEMRLPMPGLSKRQYGLLELAILMRQVMRVNKALRGIIEGH
jgi:hypothetical protein